MQNLQLLRFSNRASPRKEQSREFHSHLLSEAIFDISLCPPPLAHPMLTQSFSVEIEFPPMFSPRTSQMCKEIIRTQCVISASSQKQPEARNIVAIILHPQI